MKRKITILLIILSITTCNAQNAVVDSLNAILKTANHDTTSSKIYVQLSDFLFNENPDTVNFLCKKAISIASSKISKADPKVKKALLVIQSSAYNNIGVYFNYIGDVPKSLANFQKSLSIQEELVKNGYNEIELILGIAATSNNIGVIYYSQGNVSKALENYLKSLSIREGILNKLKDSVEIRSTKKGIATTHNNVGSIYDSQGDDIKAIMFYKKSLKIREEIGDKKGIANSLNNIGYFYQTFGDPADKTENKHPSKLIALEYYNKSLKLKEEINDQIGIGNSLSNIGYIYFIMSDSYLDKIKRDSLLLKSLDYFNKSLKIHEAVNNKYGIASTLNNLAANYLKLDKIALAVMNAERSFKLANEIGSPEDILSITSLLSRIYFKTKNWKRAYEMHVIYKQMSDSIMSETNKKASIQKGFEYEYGKKTVADSIKAGEQKIVFELQMKQEKSQRLILYFGLALITVFSIFMYNRFRVTRQQKLLIELKEKETNTQKHIIEEKHKEITDSINYAERIQRSFLASKELLDDNLKDHFIFFQPKDVVSGDFYWATKLSNNHFALVTADSTGHGVPGAIMSLLNITSLESAIKDGYKQPADILNVTRKTIIERLKRDGSAQGGKDGMDASLICFDFTDNKFSYSAANNPIWVVRNNELIELKPDKMPVGKHDRDVEPFAQQEFIIQNGDVVYALTDGFPDQFGGPQGKKFKYKQLKELLIFIAHEPMEKQKQILTDTLNSWKGDLEQVDDICVIGVRV